MYSMKYLKTMFAEKGRSKNTDFTTWYTKAKIANGKDVAKLPRCTPRQIVLQK